MARHGYSLDLIFHHVKVSYISCTLCLCVWEGLEGKEGCFFSVLRWTLANLSCSPSSGRPGLEKHKMLALAWTWGSLAFLRVEASAEGPAVPTRWSDVPGVLGMENLSTRTQSQSAKHSGNRTEYCTKESGQVQLLNIALPLTLSNTFTLLTPGLANWWLC